MRVLEKLNRLADGFDIRDINLILIESLQFLVDEFQFENGYWYKAGEIGERARQSRGENFKLYTLDDGWMGFCPFIACRPFRVEAQKAFLGSVVQALPADWEARKNIQTADLGTSVCRLIPVQSRDLGETLGHILLEGKGEPKREKDLVTVQGFLARHLTYALQFEAAKSLSYLDTLTQLYNQRYLPIALDRELHRSNRYNRPFSVLFFDIDDFKRINDNSGHLVGSAIISQIGELLRDVIRESDYGFRFGGDEFVVLLVETPVAQAEAVAERIRSMIEERPFRIAGVEHRLTVSIGVATCPNHGTTKEEILSLADKAMYHGKRKSKNVVYIAG